jgi:1-acyl-sn-glycerol-3-phosphate acyltransferase
VNDEDAQAPPDGGPAAAGALLEVVREVVGEVRAPSRVPPVHLDDDLEGDLGLDSLGLAELLVRLEERFEGSLPEGLLADVETPRDLLRHLRHGWPATATESTSADGADPRAPAPVRGWRPAEPQERHRTQARDRPYRDRGRDARPPGRVRLTTVLYGAYAWTLFAGIALVVWPLLVVLPGLERRWRVVRAAGSVLFPATGNRLVVGGEEHLPRDRPYVVVANHASFLDPLVLALLLPPPVVFTAVAGLAVNPLVRVFLRRMDVHLVERGDRLRGVEDVRRLTATVRAGRIVAFFPEGRRAPRPGLEPFKMGAFRVAADAGVPLVPVSLRGTRRIMPVGRSAPRRARVRVVVSPPATTDRTGWQGAVELQRTAREAILRHSGEADLS